MKILNLGCGSKVSAHPAVTNIDWSILLQIRSNPVLRMAAPVFVRGERRRKYNALPNNILVHNLASGIPFPDGSVDAVYHSHMLEHLDREVAFRFQEEVVRVLKPGGLQRIVVPDMRGLCETYLRHAQACEEGMADLDTHDSFIAEIIEQSVRREAYGTSRQGAWRRRVENAVLGDARKRGETHQWMYDRFNLEALLRRAGFSAVELRSHDSSALPDWNHIGLDLDPAGGEYKPGSLYMEACK